MARLANAELPNGYRAAGARLVEPATASPAKVPAASPSRSRQNNAAAPPANRSPKRNHHGGNHYDGRGGGVPYYHQHQMLGGQQQHQGGPGGRPVIDFPLRILVQSDMVGAIIGRGGQTIRAITQQTRARVDVHRRDNMGSTDKAITIYGQPENCTNACNRILKVMEDEARATGKVEEAVNLRVLAHNNLIGRIIGKQVR